MVQELTMKFNAHCCVTNKPKGNLGMAQKLAIMFTVQNWSIETSHNVHCSKLVDNQPMPFLHRSILNSIQFNVQYHTRHRSLSDKQVS